MKRIHWIIIIVAGLGITALVIWLLTKKPGKAKLGEIVTHPIHKVPVKVIKVDPITGEPTQYQGIPDPKTGKPPPIYK